MRKVLLAAASIAAVAVGAGVAVVTAAMGLFALLQEQLGAPAAYGVVAVTAAILTGVGILLAEFRLHREKKPPEEPSLSETLGRVVRERPIVAAGAAIAASLIALKNPGILGTLLSAFIAGRAAKDSPRRR
ncbi:MAG: hypothetical protein ABIO39_13180 [Caulobacteraceae bacterium]